MFIFQLRYSLVLWLMTVHFVAWSQSVAARVGANLSSAIIQYDKDQYSEYFDVSPFVGFQAGIESKLPIAKNMHIQSSLLFSTKGFDATDRLTILGNQVDTKGELVLQYIEIPVLFSLNKKNLFVAIGTYAALGIGGKGTAEARTANRVERIARDVTWGKEDGDLRRMDYGLSLNGGLKMAKLQVGLAYTYGLTDVFKYTNEGQKFKNSVVSIYLSYELLSQKRPIE